MGRILVVATIAIAVAGALGTVFYLRHLQGVAAEKAALVCEIPADTSCSADGDCILVSCRTSACVCTGTGCGVAISREAMKREHHPCLVPVGMPAPMGCPVPKCECAAPRCQSWPKCVAGTCRLELEGPVNPDGG
ncbi:MAG: hypothetical protein ACJ790_10885 [Myxococcaceae bacterium]